MSRHLSSLFIPLKRERSFSSALVAASVALALSAPLARAADAPPLEGVVSLSSSATAEVTRDLLSITFGTTRNGPDAAAVQTQLKQALDAALGEAKKAARPGQVDVETGNFSLSPHYNAKGSMDGWQGSAELVVTGRDMQAIGQLSGRINTLTISRVGYAISRELREKTEGDVSAQAIARYRAKAADYARQFGYAGYAIREVTVSGNEFQPGPRAMMMSVAKSSVASDEALPVEPGKGSVTISVNGTVQMTR